ncbi:hypothetical protein D3C73_1268320 [compost metagenome]
MSILLPLGTTKSIRAHPLLTTTRHIVMKITTTKNIPMQGTVMLAIATLDTAIQDIVMQATATPDTAMHPATVKAC